jgi:penicillin V acylase-like amidase (Ntn superfamily)
MQSKVLVIPAGKEMSGTLPDGGKGLTYTSRYAFVGANAPSSLTASTTRASPSASSISRVTPNTPT